MTDVWRDDVILSRLMYGRCIIDCILEDACLALLPLQTHTLQPSLLRRQCSA